MKALPTLTPRNTTAEQEQVLVIPLRGFKGSVELFAFFIPSNFKVFKH